MRYIFLLSFSLLLYASIDIHSIKTDFIQTITNEQNSTITYTGKLYAKDNGNALWIYKKPITKSLYFLNGKIVIIEPELEQAIFSKTQKMPKIIEILKSAKQIKDTLIANCCDTTYYIKVDKDKVISVSYHDKVGNQVMIKFYNEETNLILDDKIFEYDIPKDYDILEN